MCALWFISKRFIFFLVTAFRNQRVYKRVSEWKVHCDLSDGKESLLSELSPCVSDGSTKFCVRIEDGSLSFIKCKVVTLLNVGCELLRLALVSS